MAGDPRTPPRKRHRGKSRQSPRVSGHQTRALPVDKVEEDQKQKVKKGHLKVKKDKKEDDRKKDQNEEKADKKTKQKVKAKKEREEDAKKDNDVKKDRDDEKKKVKKEREDDAKKGKDVKKERGDENTKVVKKERDEDAKKDGKEDAKKGKDVKKDRSDENTKVVKKEREEDAKKDGKEDAKKGKDAKREEDAKKERDAKKDREEDAKNPKKEHKSKKDEKITYIPCKKQKIEHMFETPKHQIRKGPDSASGVESGISSKEMAEAQLEKLKGILEDSDDDSCSAIDDTDMEGLLNLGQGTGEEDEEDEEEEENEEKSKGEKAATDDQSEEESSSEDSSQSAGEEEEEGNDSEEDFEGEEESSGDDSDDDEGQKEEEEDEDQKDTKEEKNEAKKEGTKEKKEEKDETNGKKDKNAENMHALVPVTKETPTAIACVRNSATDKRAWDSFMRQLKSSTRKPIAVSEYATTHANRVDLFNMWLQSDRDWEKCEVLVERKLEKKNQSSKGWEAFQGKVLAQKYDEAKWNKIRESRKASGLWYQDEDFPDDDLDALFLLRRRNFSFSNPQELI